MELFLQLMCVILIGGTVAGEGADKYDETVDTESGKVCYFPFVLDAKAHSRCITAGKDRPWCALVKEIQGTSEANRNKTWDYCVIKTNGSATCHFPFTHQNDTYNDCTSTGREQDWCAISDIESGEWGYCKKSNIYTTSFCQVEETEEYLLLCPLGDVIRVLAAEVGKSENADCNVSDTDYRTLSAKFSGENLVLKILKTLQKACEFQRKCVDFDVKSQVVLPTSPASISDYVKVTYRCEQESDLYLCSDMSICTPTNNMNYSLESLHVKNCDFSQNTVFRSSCRRKNSSNIEVTGACKAEQRCQPLTELNREVYLGDVCIDSNKLVPLQCSTESIQVNFTNDEVNLRLCPNGSFPKIIDVITKPICNNTLCCGDKTVSIFEDIKEACDWEDECTVSVNVSVTSDDTNNQTCVNDSISIQTSIYHNCHRANYKCVGEYFSDTLCDASSYINVTSAVKGVSRYTEGCKPSPDDVAFAVPEEFPQYYEMILKACNERTNCSNLSADAANAYDKTNGAHIITDYVVIEYVCEQKIIETTTSLKTSTATVTTSQAVAETTSDADPSKSTVYVTADEQTGKTGLPMEIIYIIIGVVSLVLVIVVVVVICCLCKSRKSLFIEKQSNNDRPLNTYGETGEIPLGKDNASMNVGDSYDDIREKELIRKSQLEGAYQEIPTTPNNRALSMAGFSAYQDIDNKQKKKERESKVEKSNDQKPSSVCSEGAEYQDIGSMKNKERKSKLLSESGEGVAKKTIEEEGPNDDDTADIYSAKDPQAVEYAEVDKLRKSIKKPSDSTIPQDNELVENVFYEGLDNFKQPENTQSNVKGVDI